MDEQPLFDRGARGHVPGVGRAQLAGRRQSGAIDLAVRGERKSLDDDERPTMYPGTRRASSARSSGTISSPLSAAVR